MPGFIDAHVHIWTDDFEKYPLAQGFRAEEMAPRVFTPTTASPHHTGKGIQGGSGSDELLRFGQLLHAGGDPRAAGSLRGWPCRLDERRRREEHAGAGAEGVSGFRIFPQNVPAETCLEGDGLDRMFRCAAQENLVLCLLVNPEALPAVARRCAGFPDTPVVIDHLARLAWLVRSPRAIRRRSVRWPAIPKSR